MKNPVVFYAAIALGVIALGVGFYLMTHGHHMSAYGGMGASVLLLIVGVAGMVVAKPKAAAK